MGRTMNKPVSQDPQRYPKLDISQSIMSIGFLSTSTYGYPAVRQ